MRPRERRDSGRGRSSALAVGSDHRHAPSAGGAGAKAGLGVYREDVRGDLLGLPRSTAAADAADGGADHPQMRPRPLRRALGEESEDLFSSASFRSGVHRHGHGPSSAPSPTRATTATARHPITSSGALSRVRGGGSPRRSNARCAGVPAVEPVISHIKAVTISDSSGHP